MIDNVSDRLDDQVESALMWTWDEFILVDIENKYVSISFVNWNGSFGIRDIKSLLISEEEIRLVKRKEDVEGLLLVWFTDVTWIVPKYVVEALKINYWNIEILPRDVIGGAEKGSNLIFVKVQWAELFDQQNSVIAKVELLLN